MLCKHMHTQHTDGNSVYSQPIHQTAHSGPDQHTVYHFTRSHWTHTAVWVNLIPWIQCKNRTEATRNDGDHTNTHKSQPHLIIIHPAHNYPANSSTNPTYNPAFSYQTARDNTQTVLVCVHEEPNTIQMMCIPKKVQYWHACLPRVHSCKSKSFQTMQWKCLQIWYQYTETTKRSEVTGYFIQWTLYSSTCIYKFSCSDTNFHWEFLRIMMLMSVLNKSIKTSILFMAWQILMCTPPLPPSPPLSLSRSLSHTHTQMLVFMVYGDSP